MKAKDHSVAIGTIVGYGALFAIGAVYQYNTKRQLKKILNAKATRRSEVTILLVEMMNYIADSVTDDNISVEEFNETLKEKKAYIELVKSI